MEQKANQLGNQIKQKNMNLSKMMEQNKFLYL